MKYYNLTTPQKNIWNLLKYYNDTAIGNQCGAIFFNEKRDSGLLRQALWAVISCQTGLRLRFRENGEAEQYVSTEIADIPVMSFDTMEEYESYAKKFAKEPIGLIDCTMYRMVIFDVAGMSGVLVAMSHLISDAWTFSVVAAQTDAAYRSLVDGVKPEVQEADYTEYIQSENEYFHSDRYSKDKSFWESRYSAQPEKGVIRIRSTEQDDISADRITEKLSPVLERNIVKYCDEHQITPAVLFETALIIYLSKINPDNHSVTLGIPVLNRKNTREKRIAGMFVSTMPLTVELGADTVITELIEQITSAHMEIFRHQKYPYSDILKYLREKQSFSGNLYDAMISYQNAVTKTGARTEWYSNGYSEVPFVMHIDNRDSGKSHTINIDYQTAVFKDKREAEYIATRIEYILEQITLGEAVSAGDISIVPHEEMLKLVDEFNDTYVEYPREKCVHELFTEQAEKTPDRTALVFENESFTYKQLDEMSNSLAHFLREKGVKRNDIVPIIAKRSWHVIVAMLGIMKAGGAYMPVSPNFPLERMEYMFEVSNAKIAISYGFDSKKLMNNSNVEIIDAGLIDYSRSTGSIENINNSEDTCYVIFTSGSTGKPKGVMICHINVVNYCDNNNNNVCSKVITYDNSKIVSVTNIVFDIFVTESILPLLNQKTIFLANDEETVSQGKLSALILNNNIDIMQTTPTKMKSIMLDKNNLQYLRTFKTIILGGEALSEGLYKELSRYTDARIFNIYGPAETTVWSTNAQIFKDDITIGKPIANTQIYIIDKNNNPLPIGVAGELCIAGEGVGKGYLNRPELTREKFVPNPFATAENGHGKIMYHTGDLARWRADGEIEYLGRIDTQVKIRGLRIELGEIESVMSSFEGINLTAVADKKDANNRQYLVGYYTAEHEIDEKELRSHLSSKLPKYMVPNYFMRLDEMPMTASGKTDRKNLPVPDFTAQKREYAAPETPEEIRLCELLQELLQVERIGAEDDFFEYGGDSLTAIEYTAKAHGIGIEISLQDIFDYPTVRKLCMHLAEGTKEKVNYQASDFEKYDSFFNKNVISGSQTFTKKKLGNILLTGATGFLGAHVLDQFMQNEDGRIYCLIRSNSEYDRRGRLSRVLEYYFGDKYEAEIDHRIIPVIGNIEDEKLADDMPEDVQTVIHTAASVKHYGSYEYFHKINTEGTAHVVDYARRIGARLIHISTLSVSGNSLADDFSVYRSENEKFFDETSFYIGQPLDNVYIHSKFEAERKVYDAMLDGLDAVVIRVGNLTNRASDYRFQPNYRENAFLTRMKAILEFGLFPDYLLKLYAEFSPVDKTAEGVLKIAQYADGQCVFHLNSNKVIYFDRLLEVVHELGISMDVVGGEQFNEALQKTIKSSDTEYIFEAFQNDMDEQGHLVYDSNIRIGNEFTLWFLEKTGFEWNETDAGYIKGYIDYFRKIGYLGV
ncbi:MAG: amino acid adenylation domain-containing protein [Clostridia bacterium]|nr:amino acid adenylation domain-containing protein [Clostridia bacterium]